MRPQLSVYMDAVRLAAAFVVLLAHASELMFEGVPLPFPGKDAVIVFFVLSGFVIAFVAREKTAICSGTRSTAHRGCGRS